MKKVLFVTYDFPYPTNSGGKNRAYHMLKYSGKEFKKYLFSFIRDDFKREHVSRIEEIGVEFVGTEKRRRVSDVKNIFGLLSGSSIFKTLYFSDEILESLVRIIRKYEIDVVHFESFYTAFYISDAIRDLGVKQVFGTENIEHNLYRDYAAKSPFFLKPLYELQVQKIKDEEAKLFKRADVCIAVSEPDAKVVREFNECEIIRNGVDIDKFDFKKPAKEAKNLLFVGNFSYFPNVDAINYFYREVFKNLGDNVRLTVVGKKVSTLKLDCDKKVEPIEFIPEIQEAYKNADIMVAPIRIGGGTNFKILEAMAAGVPVVSFPQRLEGLDVEDGKNILIAKDTAEFGSKIEELLSSHALRKKLAENARKLIEREYSWKIIGNNLATVWGNL